MKDLKIEIPDEFILDEEKYKNNIIAFLPKPIDPLAHLPKSWEELKEIGGYYVNRESEIIRLNNSILTCEFNKCVVPTESQAKAILALCQLLQLRDRYNDGEKLVIDGKTSYYSIGIIKNNIERCRYIENNCILKFKTEELRDHFLQHHIALIEEAKELL